MAAEPVIGARDLEGVACGVGPEAPYQLSIPERERAGGGCGSDPRCGLCSRNAFHAKTLARVLQLAHHHNSLMGRCGTSRRGHPLRVGLR